MADVKFDFSALRELQLDDDFREWFQDRLIGEVSKWRGSQCWTVRPERLRKNATRFCRLVWDKPTQHITLRINPHLAYPIVVPLKVFGYRKESILFKDWKEVLVYCSGFWYSFTRWESTATTPRANRTGLRWLSDWLVQSDSSSRTTELRELLDKLEGSSSKTR